MVIVIKNTQQSSATSQGTPIHPSNSQCRLAKHHVWISTLYNNLVMLCVHGVQTALFKQSPSCHPPRLGAAQLSATNLNTVISGALAGQAADAVIHSHLAVISVICHVLCVSSSMVCSMLGVHVVLQEEAGVRQTWRIRHHKQQ